MQFFLLQDVTKGRNLNMELSLSLPKSLPGTVVNKASALAYASSTTKI
jgi:hypothetical protein